MDSHINGTIRRSLKLSDHSYFSTTKKLLNKKKHLTINTINIVATYSLYISLTTIFR